MLVIKTVAMAEWINNFNVENYFDSRRNQRLFIPEAVEESLFHLIHECWYSKVVFE